jgi:hypothetical protein
MNLVTDGTDLVKEIAWRARRVKDNLVKKELAKMIAEGEVLPVAIERLKVRHSKCRIANK